MNILHFKSCIFFYALENYMVGQNIIISFRQYNKRDMSCVSHALFFQYSLFT